MSAHDCDAPGDSYRELETGYEVQFIGPESDDEDDWLDHGHGTTSPEVAHKFVDELRMAGIAPEKVRINELVTIRRLIPPVELRARVLVEKEARAAQG